MKKSDAWFTKREKEMSITCKPLGDSINDYTIYEKATATCGNANSVSLDSVSFYGKNANDKPIFAVMNYDTFRNAKMGMIIASVLAAGLGITAIVLGVKLAKAHKMSVIG